MKAMTKTAILGIATLCIAGGVVLAQGRRDTDPLPAFSFMVEIDGLPSTRVAEVHGILSETETNEYRTGGDRGTMKLPGKHHLGNVLLRRGLTGDQSWWEWRRTVVDGQVQRRSVALALQDDEGSEVLRVLLYDTWPVAWRLSPLNANGSEAAWEELELTVERIELDS
jgi:phage tail-like protein